MVERFKRKTLDRIWDYNNILVLTGAGISAESGIKTFRDANGLWENHRIDEVASPKGFERDPELVHRFYNARRVQMGLAKPNAAHIALARFERKFTETAGKTFRIVTQNVDDLHERAGSVFVHHMHGQLGQVRCIKTGTVFSRVSDLSTADRCGCCNQPGSLRPHICWFGEVPFKLQDIYAWTRECDLFVAIGTSGHVWPANGLVDLATDYQAETVEINLKRTVSASRFDHGYYGSATEEVQYFFEQMVEGL